MRFLSIVLVVLVSGCGLVAQQKADEGIARYYEVREGIRLGDDRDSVLAVLQPINETIPPQMRRPSEQFMRDGALVEIHYARSARFPDNRSTDDEYTPYVFVDGVLASMGWRALGGPVTVAQPRKSTPPPPGYSFSSGTQQDDGFNSTNRACEDALRRQKMGTASDHQVNDACVGRVGF